MRAQERTVELSDANDQLQQSLQEKLVVQDNGIGLPEGFDYRKSRSLGLQLISILSRQLQIGIKLAAKREQSSLSLFRCVQGQWEIGSNLRKIAGPCLGASCTFVLYIHSQGI